MIDSDWILINNLANISNNWEIINPLNSAGNLYKSNIVSIKHILKLLSFENIGFNNKSDNLIKDRFNLNSKYFTVQYMIKQLHETFNTNRVLIGFKIMHDCHYFYH